MREQWRRKDDHFKTRSNETPFTFPPAIEFRTFFLNPSLLSLKSSAASLFNGSDAFGSRNKNCIPTITALRLSTGFQSSLKIFRHTFPSRSMFGWYIFCVHFTLGGSWGKFWLMLNVKLKLPPLYIPSSGSMVRVKLRMSSGLGKDIFIVEPRESSCKSLHPRRVSNPNL